jgi:hypothetical protein
MRNCSIAPIWAASPPLLRCVERHEAQSSPLPWLIQCMMPWWWLTRCAARVLWRLLCVGYRRTRNHGRSGPSPIHGLVWLGWTVGAPRSSPRQMANPNRLSGQ